VVRPLSGGVITDFERTQELLARLIRKACPSHRPHPRLVVMSMPGVATGVEKRAIEEACLSAGARRASLIGAPMAAAIGARLPINEPAGSMVVDVGGGTCEAAVIALGEIVVSRSIRAGGGDFDEAIIKHLRRDYGLLIGMPAAEQVRVEIGSTHPVEDVLDAEVSGRERRSGLPKTVTVGSPAIRAVLERPVARIIETVTETLRETPPELGADIIDRGLMLTGGGSRLRGLAERLRQETQLPVHLAELPITCVAAGSGAWLEELATQRRFDQEIVEWAA
jgi:rod shape-determining protein MreB